MKQKEAVNKKKNKADLLCSACHCRMWLWDDSRHSWQGEYHFQECPAVPGGAELLVRNLEEKAKWEEEQFVPRKQGVRILEAIRLLVNSPGGKGKGPSEIFLQRRQAIFDELAKMGDEAKRSNPGIGPDDFADDIPF